MPGTDVNVLQDVSRILPSPSPDGAVGNPVARPRGGRYREQYILSLIPTKHLLADEGSYFVATNPTPGTGLTLTTTAQNSFSDTTPQIYIYNSDVLTGLGKRIMLDYIRFLVTAVPTAATLINYVIKGDSVARALSTNNMTAITPVNANMDSGNKSIMSLNVQNSATASVIAASSPASRFLSRGSLGMIPIVGDELVLHFGGFDPSPFPYAGTANTLANRRVAQAPPIIVGPGESLVLHIWFSGTSTASLVAELEMGWFER